MTTLVSCDLTSQHRCLHCLTLTTLEARKSSEVCYSHSNRRLHLAHAQAYYGKAIDALFESPNGLGSQDGVVIMDLTIPGIKFSLEALNDSPSDDFPTWDPFATIPSAQSHLKPRFQALVDEFRSPADRLASSRLVELIIPFGDGHAIILTVRLDRSGERWVARYSIYRFW